MFTPIVSMAPAKKSWIELEATATDNQRLPAENAFVHLLAETNNHRFANQKRRCSQVTGGAKDQLEQFLLARIVLFQIDFDHLFTFGGAQPRSFLQHLQSLIFLMRTLFRVHFRFRCDPSIRKKLLRFGAGLSATPVVAPVNFLGHVRFLDCEVGLTISVAGS